MIQKASMLALNESNLVLLVLSEMTCPSGKPDSRVIQLLAVSTESTWMAGWLCYMPLTPQLQGNRDRRLRSKWVEVGRRYPLNER